MKHCALTILALLCTFACTAQQYEEVEFEVKKSEPIIQLKEYYYTVIEQRLRDTSERTMLIRNENDTLFFYWIRDRIHAMDTVMNIKLGCLYPSRLGDSIGILMLRMQYAKSGDSTLSIIYTNNGRADTGILFSSEMISRPIPIFPLIFAQYARKQRVFLIDSNVTVAIGDTSYSCTKLLASSIHFHKRTITFGKNKRNPTYIWIGHKKMHSVVYYYFRNADMLPIKIETAASVSKLDITKNYEIIERSATLKMAVE
jgi:hypothetical protein